MFIISNALTIYLRLEACVKHYGHKKSNMNNECSMKKKKTLQHNTAQAQALTLALDTHNNKRFSVWENSARLKCEWKPVHITKEKSTREICTLRIIIKSSIGWGCAIHIHTRTQYILYIQTGNDIAQSIFFLQLLLCERSRMCDRALCILYFSALLKMKNTRNKNKKKTTEKQQREVTSLTHIGWNEF